MNRIDFRIVQLFSNKLFPGFIVDQSNTHFTNRLAHSITFEYCKNDMVWKKATIELKQYCIIFPRREAYLRMGYHPETNTLIVADGSFRKTRKRNTGKDCTDMS